MKSRSFATAALALSSILFASAVQASEVAPRCTTAGLARFREGPVKEWLKNGQPAEAANGLSKYLEQNDCYGALVGLDQSSDSGKAGTAGLRAYFWALSDLSFAYLKAGQYGNCLGLGRTLLEQGDTNYRFETANDPKLSAAVAANVKACEQGRLRDLTPVKLAACPLPLAKVRLSVGGFSEGNELLTKNVKTVKSSFALNDGRCLALVEIQVNSQDYADLDEGKKIDIPYLIEVGPKSDSPARILPWVDKGEPDEHYCGLTDIESFQNADKEAFFLVKGDYSYCHGGSAHFIAETLWKAGKERAEKVDGFFEALH